MDTSNVTLSLPKPLLRRFRVYAASVNQSMSGLLVQAIQELVDEGGEYERAKKRAIERMKRTPDTGIDRITWTRDELYDR